MSDLLSVHAPVHSRRSRPGVETVVIQQRPSLAWEPPPRRQPPLIDYLLAIPSNGRGCLRETLESFRQRVRPAPRHVLVLGDGCEVEPWAGGTAWSEIPWTTTSQEGPRGFCETTRTLWALCADASPDFVFWLEDDFVFERDLDLRPLAEVLFEEPMLTQMALMRGPANDAEEAAGGCMEAAPWAYEERDGWMVSSRNHSTGCSLMRRAFMEANPWPEYPDACEGRFSIDLLARGFRFGVWGLGEPWVKHVGVRSGWGY